MKKYIKSNSYDETFVNKHIMGPNPLYLLEEICNHMTITPDMKILDLGCGMGLTSIFLAKEYGATVYATDLWIKPTENLERIRQFGLEDKVIPIYADANALPYAEDYFDAVVAIDSYHYFAYNNDYFTNVLSKLLKKNAQIGIAVPGLTHEVDGLPKYFDGIWAGDGFDTFGTLESWKDIFGKSNLVDIVSSGEIEKAREMWYHWGKIARERLNFNDDDILDADEDKLLTLIYLVAKMK